MNRSRNLLLGAMLALMALAGWAQVQAQGCSLVCTCVKLCGFDYASCESACKGEKTCLATCAANHDACVSNCQNDIEVAKLPTGKTR